MTLAARVTYFYIKSVIRLYRLATVSLPSLPFCHRFSNVSLPFRYLSFTVHPPKKKENTLFVTVSLPYDNRSSRSNDRFATVPLPFPQF